MPNSWGEGGLQSFRPTGLRICLLDADTEARKEAEVALHSLGYHCTPFNSAQQLADHFQEPGSKQEFDVLLADADTIAAAEAIGAGSSDVANNNALLSAIVGSGVPLVLTSSRCVPSVVMHGINKLGAVDFLEKPLSMLKLKNIWQHKVRRMLSSSGAAGCPSPPPRRLTLRRSKSAAVGAVPVSHSSDVLAEHGNGVTHAAGAAQPQQQQSAGSHSGPVGGGGHSTSAGTGAMESGSVISTSDGMRGNDAPCSSMGRVDSTQVAGLACGLSHLLMGDDGDLSGGLLGDMCGLLGGDSAEGQPATQQPQPQAQQGTPQSPVVMPAPRRCQSALLPNELGAGSLAVGHASGRLPDLPEGQPGIVWGLPTSPLKMVPMPHCISPPPGMLMHSLMMGCMPPPGMLSPAAGFNPAAFMSAPPGGMPLQMPADQLLTSNPMMSFPGMFPIIPPPYGLMHPGMVPSPSQTPSILQQAMQPMPSAATAVMSTNSTAPAPTNKSKGSRSSVRRAQQQSHAQAQGHAQARAAAPQPAAPPQSAMPAQPTSSEQPPLSCTNLLLDPLAVLEGRDDDDAALITNNDALRPLDPSLLDSSMVGIEMTSTGDATAALSSTDAADLDWLLLPGTGAYTDSAPLPLPKSGSLVDICSMIMDMDPSTGPMLSAGLPDVMGDKAGFDPELMHSAQNELDVVHQESDLVVVAAAPPPPVKSSVKRSSSRRQQQRSAAA